MSAIYGFVFVASIFFVIWVIQYPTELFNTMFLRYGHAPKDILATLATWVYFGAFMYGVSLAARALGAS